jgi:hypothetical protein
LDVFMSSSDSIDAQPDPSPDPEPTVPDGIDPAIAEAVDGVGNRFGAQGLEQMIAYAQEALAAARAALEQLADTDE